MPLYNLFLIICTTTIICWVPIDVIPDSKVKPQFHEILSFIGENYLSEVQCCHVLKNVLKYHRKKLFYNMRKKTG